MKKVLTSEQFVKRAAALLKVWEDTSCAYCGGPVCDSEYDIFTIRSRMDDYGRVFCGSECLETLNP